MTDREKELAKIKKANDMAGKDVESSGDDSDGDKPLFVNPLAAAAKQPDQSSEEWSDDDLSQDGKGKKKSKKDKTILGKRKRKGSMDAV